MATISTSEMTTVASMSASGTSASSEMTSSVDETMGTTDGELCGNGLIDVGEECDDWNDEDDDICVHCMNAFCGDGYRLLGVEDCDDGNGEDADACHNDCTNNQCGDGVPGGDG